MFNYACRLLSYGLLSRNISDATKEGDGERICRLYKCYTSRKMEEQNMHYKQDAGWHAMLDLNDDFNPLTTTDFI